MHCVYTVFMFVYFMYEGVHSNELFERYSGLKVHDSDKSSRQCSVVVNTCTPHEGSRIDGTCNNYNRPSRGSAMGPYMRLLKTDYGYNGGIRRNRESGPLPSARKVRTMIQSTGRVVDKTTFNMAATNFFEFINNDITVVNGSWDYLRNRTYCCKNQGTDDHRCAPIPVPHNDPYLKSTGIQCMNYSRVETFQDRGCVTKLKEPEQINLQTPMLDLSTVYGINEMALKGIRQFEHGLLRETKRKGRTVPLNETEDYCFGNKGPDSICYKFGYPLVGNFDLTSTTLTIFFYREHNRIARILQELNPCWKDDRLFKVARQINIATAANIFMYELLPILLGYKNMLSFGLISNSVEYVAAYDEDTDPLVYAEYEVAKRFFHTFWDGRIKKYDEHYHYVGEFSLSDTLFRQELIEQDTNFEEINRGTFYQKAANIDDIQDPDISEHFYSQFLRAHDLAAIDIQIGRDMGLQGYNGYRRLCGLEPAKKFEDLLDVMSEEKIAALKRLYHELEDVDLLAGIMSEDIIPGTFVGPTLFCIMAKQYQVFRFSDRFWFERGKQFHSFTLTQLQEIRKTNMARFACDNAEGIKFIQPHALLNVGHGNSRVPCTHIAGADLTKWKDHSCHQQQPGDYQRMFLHSGHQHYIQHKPIIERVVHNKEQSGSKINGNNIFFGNKYIFP